MLCEKIIQKQRFIEKARELGRDEDKTAFDEQEDRVGAAERREAKEAS